MKKWLIVCLVFVGLAAGYGCKGTTEPVVKHPPTITSFTADPTTIHTGEASVLTWNVTGATTLYQPGRRHGDGSNGHQVG